CDREKKRGEYARAGVREYWLIDPRPGKRGQPTLTLYRLGEDGTYGAAPPLRAGMVRSTVVPGFWLRVEWLWQDPVPAALTLLAEVLRYPVGPEAPDALAALAALPYAVSLLEQQRAEGEAQGRVEGLRAAVRRLVEARFGGVPPA